jgi:iron complex outermembrane recepter protein
VATFFVQVNDPVTGQTGVQVSGVFAGNPNLQPEKSRSTTLGVVWEPNNAFNASMDFYQITWANIVGYDSFQSVVNANDPSRVIRDPTTNNIVTVLNNYRNLSEHRDAGRGHRCALHRPHQWGRFTTRLNTTYVDEFEEEGVECAGTNGAPTPTRAGRATSRWTGIRARGPSQAA